MLSCCGSSEYVVSSMRTSRLKALRNGQKQVTYHAARDRSRRCSRSSCLLRAQAQARRKNRMEGPLTSGRGDWIRTSDLSVPNRALYQAEPRPDRTASVARGADLPPFVQHLELEARGRLPYSPCRSTNTSAAVADASSSNSYAPETFLPVPRVTDRIFSVCCRTVRSARRVRGRTRSTKLVRGPN